MATARATSKSYHQKARYREFLILLLQKYDICCFFCHKPITEEDLPARKVDAITIHHEDENRSNNAYWNLWLAHRGCHKHYHTYKRLEGKEAKHE